MTDLFLQQNPESPPRKSSVAHRFWSRINDRLRKEFNKNIYTKVLFSNLTVFMISLIGMTFFSGYVVKQVTYHQLQQDLLRKAKLVNSILQLMERKAQINSSGQTSLETARQNWKRAQRLFQIRAISQRDYEKARADFQRAVAAQINEANQAKQEHLSLLADLINARTITIFNQSGDIIAASTGQEASSGKKIAENLCEALQRDEIVIIPAVDRQTGRFTFNAVVPMANGGHDIEKNGILLEMKPPNIDLALDKMYLYSSIMGIVILLVIICCSVYLATSISRPISRLTTLVAEISKGGEVLNFEGHPLDEINVLAGQLNKLAVRLEKIQTESSKMGEERARLFTEISHELRTPLTSIQGFVEAIRDGMVQDQALLDKYLNTIYLQTVHITRLVDDLLTLGRLESGNITVEKQPLDIIALSQSVISLLETEASRSNNSLQLEKKTEKAIIIGDVDRMEQILKNLLKNAIKATENGSIILCVDVRQGEVVITITDNGIGIAAEDLTRIWDRFYRVKNPRGGLMEEKGSGLGLAIVKKLVQLQGGNIKVESQLGKGTTFTMSFPAFDHDPDLRRSR